MTVLFLYFSACIVRDTRELDGLLSGALYAYHIVRVLMQFFAVPLRWYLYRESNRLLKLDEAAELHNGVLALMRSRAWRFYTSLGEVMSICIATGIVMGLYSAWAEFDEELQYPLFLHACQTVFQVAYAIFTAYRYGVVFAEGDGLQTIRQAKGISSREELAKFTKLYKFVELPESQKESCRSSGCVVCYGEYEDQQEVRELPCSHVYHAECVDSWLQSKSLCPTCQHDVSTPFVKNKERTANPVFEQSDAAGSTATPTTAAKTEQRGVSAPVMTPVPSASASSPSSAPVTAPHAEEEARSRVGPRHNFYSPPKENTSYNNSNAVSRRQVRIDNPADMKELDGQTSEVFTQVHALASPTTPSLECDGTTHQQRNEMDSTALIRA